MFKSQDRSAQDEDPMAGRTPPDRVQRERERLRIEREKLENEMERLQEQQQQRLEQLREALDDRLDRIRDAFDEKIERLEEMEDRLEEMEDEMEDRDTALENADQLREVLDVVSEKIPGLMQGIQDTVFSPESSKQMAESIAEFFRTLVDAGISGDIANSLTMMHMSNLQKTLHARHIQPHSRLMRADRVQPKPPIDPTNQRDAGPDPAGDGSEPPPAPAS